MGWNLSPELRARCRGSMPAGDATSPAATKPVRAKRGTGKAARRKQANVRAVVESRVEGDVLILPIRVTTESNTGGNKAKIGRRRTQRFVTGAGLRLMKRINGGRQVLTLYVRQQRDRVAVAYAYGSIEFDGCMCGSSSCSRLAARVRDRQQRRRQELAAVKRLRHRQQRRRQVVAPPFEQLGRTTQLLVLDREGEFVTLREKLDLLLVGPGARLPADVRSAPLLVRRLMEKQICAVVDMSEMKLREQRHVRPRFPRGADRAAQGPVAPVLRRARRDAPVLPGEGAGEAESTEAVINLATLGRKRGFCRDLRDPADQQVPQGRGGRAAQQVHRPHHARRRPEARGRRAGR
jgi:hypothetical protein